MLIPRRKILTGAIAAPFVLRSGLARALPFPRGSVSSGGGGSDATATALASLPLSQWSSDLATNHINDSAFITALGGNEPIFDSSNPFAFGSGVYMKGQKKWRAAGAGGHVDSANTGIFHFDFPTLTWVVTEKSAIYHTSANGLTPLSADPGNIIQDINTPPSTDYFVWPNADGHRTQWSSHLYSSSVWMPEIGYGYSACVMSWPGGGTSGKPNGGYYLWNASGLYDQTTGKIAGPGGAGADCHWISGLRKIWFTDPSGNGWNFDPIAGTETQTHGFGSGPNGGITADVNIQSPGAIIPDPNNPGDTCYVFWQNGGTSLTGGAGVAYYPKVGSGATGQYSSRLASLANVPASQAWATTLCYCSCWFAYAGDFKTGSPIILVWNWGGTSDGYHVTQQGDGIWLINSSSSAYGGIASWSYSGSPLPSSAPPYSPTIGGESGFKCVFVLEDYVSVGNYLPIAVISPEPDGTGTLSQVYFYKIPWSAL